MSRVSSREGSEPSTESSRPSYKGLRPASARASAAARGSSKKVDTAVEVKLRRALWAAGCRYRKNVSGLSGRPDIVFPGARLAIFCDGDFWHGRDWEARKEKLGRGTNAPYWVAKIQRNIDRDRETTAHLEGMGWRVLRFWESEIKASVEAVAATVKRVLTEKAPLDKNRSEGIKRA